MPYYIYRITPIGPVRQLTQISFFDQFKEASNEAKRLRRETDLNTGEQIKTIFADNPLHAEELLSEIRYDEPRTGEDY